MKTFIFSFLTLHCLIACSSFGQAIEPKASTQSAQAEQINQQAVDALQSHPQSNFQMDWDRVPRQLQWLRPILDNQKVMSRAQRLIALIENPAFQANSRKIVDNPNLKWLYVGLGIVFVSYLLLKRRVLAATDRWLIRGMLRLASMAVFFVGIFVVSYAVLGQPLVYIVWAVKDFFI